ncbi:hypothetical protein RchiOBHm_Chr6g0265901 [Rosa chinensis]|uniref:Uncharacterized protein n=1 Tax=Rosa chinensis TaxID=74649 RepID=A0A2P6PPI5_ROSCH|nr:hypothetical protein RchiOBHm_Chr6g0265901 [Rosa chinensis]
MLQNSEKMIGSCSLSQILLISGGTWSRILEGPEKKKKKKDYNNIFFLGFGTQSSWEAHPHAYFISCIN